MNNFFFNRKKTSPYKNQFSSLNLICFFTFLLISTKTWSATTVVFLDPGHGGKDSGAYESGIKESTLVLKVSLYLEKLLKKDPRFKVHMSRKTDTFITLENREAMSKIVKADIFLSLHINSFKDPSFKGAQFYFLNQLSPEKESLHLAYKHTHKIRFKNDSFSQYKSHLGKDIFYILEDLKKNQKIKLSSKLAVTLASSWRGLKTPKKLFIQQAPFFLLQKLEIPAVFVEMGFLSNSYERKKLRQASYQKNIAQGLYSGLINFKEYLDKYK